MREPDKSRKSAWWQRSRLGRDLLKDEAGGVLVYMTILIPVMMGIIGLAVDASRLFILNTEQKDMADAAAIAGAWELDGEYVDEDDNAIVRAMNAARDVVSNNPRWASDNPDVHIESIRFCEFLTGPPHERRCALDEDGTAGYLTPVLSDATDSRRAYFIEVITETRRVFPSFLVAVGAVAEPQSNAIAIAGSSIVACNIHSLMICNPYEIPGDPNSPPFTANEGQMFLFKAKNAGGGGGPASFAPGDFGLVDHPDHPASGGAGATRDLLSMQSRAICIHSLVSPHQGHETQMVNRGINVRFDEDSFNCNQQCKAEKIAAPHVLKGSTTSCSSNNPGPYTAAHQYPDDTDINSEAAQYGSVSIGNGIMDGGAKNIYWQHHHGTNWPVDVTTRYEAYKREIEMIENDLWGKSPLPEDPEPSCLPKSEHGAERRILNAAVVDCNKYGVKGNSVNNIRVDTYAEFFITKPSEGGKIYTEFLRMMTPDTHGSKLKRIVQLYR